MTGKATAAMGNVDSTKVILSDEHKVESKSVDLSLPTGIAAPAKRRKIS